MDLVAIMLFTQQVFSFTMFIFLVITFDTLDCYYFEPNLSVVLLVQNKKTMFCSFLTLTNDFPS